MSLLERFEKLAAEDFAENPLRKKKAIILRAHPMGMIARQTAGSDDAVNVGVVASAPTIEVNPWSETVS